MASIKQKLIDLSSHKNANGDLLCGVACVDMVEDRVRKRWTAVALLFSFLAPILTYSCIGNFRDAWDRSWEPRYKLLFKNSDFLKNVRFRLT